jgi:flagellar basal body P-ring formation protein FlgA
MPHAFTDGARAAMCDAVGRGTATRARAGASGGNGVPSSGRGLPSWLRDPAVSAERRTSARLERHETVSARWHSACCPERVSTPQSLPGALPPRRARARTHALTLALALLAAHSGSRAEGPSLGSVGARLINQAAENAVRAEAGATPGRLFLTPAPLDPRLRLPACDQPLHAFLTDGQVRQQTTLGVRCEGSVRWTIYTGISVESEAPVLVARTALPRDATLTAADFQLVTRRVPGLIGSYLCDPAALAQQRLRRPLAAGEALAIDALAPALLIHRGQQVVLLARSPGIEVRMAGVALGDGRASDQIRVQNTSSQRIVEGTVRADGVVEVPL